jgi:hypothetical protein
MRAHRLVPLLALALLAAPAAAQTEPPPPPVASEPWRPPPGFFTGWARGGAFLPTTPDFQDARVQSALGVGFGVDLLSLVTVAAEASFTDRDFATPGAPGSRVAVESIGLGLLARVHHPFWRLEPGVTVGGVWLDTRLSADSGGTGRARGLGFLAGAGLDVLLGEGFAVGADWRWLLARGRFATGSPSVSLSGHMLGGLVRIAWP